MRKFTILTIILFSVAVFENAFSQTIQNSGARQSNLSARSGLTIDVDKTDLNASVNIYSYENSLFINISDVANVNGKYGVFNMNGQLIHVGNINSNVTRYDVETNSKGIYVVRALVNGKLYNKKLFVQ